MMRENVLLYTNFIDKFERLSDEQFGMLIRAILEYQSTGEIPEITDSIVALSFDTVKPDIDRNNQKYEDMCERNRINGKKGGRPKKEENPNKPSGFLENRVDATETDSNPNDNDNEYDNENDIDIVNQSNSLHSLDCINSSETSSDKSEDEKYQDLIKDLKKRNEENKVKQIVAEYERVCTSLPGIRKLSKQRSGKVRARLKAFTDDEIFLAFKKAEESDFLSGRSGTWKASFDWFFENDQNITKVLEGNYDNKPISKPKPKNNFNNFKQRNYDMQALEKQLLGRATSG